MGKRKFGLRDVGRGLLKVYDFVNPPSKENRCIKCNRIISKKYRYCSACYAKHSRKAVEEGMA